MSTPIAIIHHFRCFSCEKYVEKSSAPAQCSACGAYGSYRPAVGAEPPQPSHLAASVYTPPVSYARPLVQGQGLAPGVVSMVQRPRARAVPLSSVSAADVPRRAIHPAIDYVLGGEIVEGVCIPGVAESTVTQLSGERGCGKSTLIAQALGSVCLDGVVLYVTAEESDAAVGARVRRIGIDLDAEPWKSNFLIIATDVVEDAWDEIRRLRPLAWVLDSEQTMRSIKIDAKKKSAAMVAYLAQGSFDLAHATRFGCGFLICQENKDGEAAGPKVAEHAVDACLSVTREYGSIRVLSCTGKNRNGPDTRHALLEMTSRGLVLSTQSLVAHKEDQALKSEENSAERKDA